MNIKIKKETEPKRKSQKKNNNKKEKFIEKTNIINSRKS